jgi:hypothetical protein
MSTSRERWTTFGMGAAAAATLCAVLMLLTWITTSTAPACQSLAVQIVVFGDHATAVPDGVTVRWCKGAQTIRFSDPPAPVLNPTHSE